MKDLLVYILNNLVDNPDQVQVEETVDENGLVTLNATVASEDMGKVIGKAGKVINAIRQVVRIRAIKEGKRVTINVAEPAGSAPRPTPTPENTVGGETPAEPEKTAAQAEETPSKTEATPSEENSSSQEE